MVGHAPVKEQPALSLCEGLVLSLEFTHQVVSYLIEFLWIPCLLECFMSIPEDIIVVNEPRLGIAEPLRDITFEEPGDLRAIIVVLFGESIDESTSVLAGPCDKLEFCPTRHPFNNVVNADIVDGQSGRILVIRKTDKERRIRGMILLLTRLEFILLRLKSGYQFLDSSQTCGCVAVEEV